MALQGVLILAVAEKVVEKKDGKTELLNFILHCADSQVILPEKTLSVFKIYDWVENNKIKPIIIKYVNSMSEKEMNELCMFVI